MWGLASLGGLTKCTSRAVELQQLQCRCHTGIRKTVSAQSRVVTHTPGQEEQHARGAAEARWMQASLTTS